MNNFFSKHLKWWSFLDEELLNVGGVMEPGVTKFIPIFEGKSAHPRGHRTTQSCAWLEASTKVRQLLLSWVASLHLTKKTGSERTTWAQNFDCLTHWCGFGRRTRRRCENFDKRWLGEIWFKIWKTYWIIEAPSLPTGVLTVFLKI